LAKKNCKKIGVVSELKKCISKDKSISIRKQCELLDLAPSSYYHKGKGESPENQQIMRLMDEEFMEHPTHGVYQMQDFLLACGLIVNHKRVRRLLRKMNIMAIYPQKNLSKLGQAKYIHPYLLRHLKICRSNQVWAIDITYIPMKHGFMYLTAIIDVHSRYVVGWGLFNDLRAENCLQVLQNAIRQNGKPEIINSDQGSQFTCPLWVDYLENEEIQISMDGKGRALDNIFIERLWRTVKRDYVYLNPPENGRELYAGLSKFFKYYNEKKTHQGINRMIPAQVYKKTA
jgi:putative transposase